MRQPLLTLTDVGKMLNISDSQIYRLVRRGELEAVKIGGKGQWRVAPEKVEEYLTRMYEETQRFVEEHPFEEADSDADSESRSEAASGLS